MPPPPRTTSPRNNVRGTACYQPTYPSPLSLSPPCPKCTHSIWISSLINILQYWKILCNVKLMHMDAGNKTYYVAIIPVHSRSCRRVITALHAQRQTSRHLYGSGYVETRNPGPVARSPIPGALSSGSSGFLHRTVACCF